MNGTAFNGTAIVTFDYPYRDDDFKIRFETDNNNIDCDRSFDSGTFSGSAEYFVAMGVFTMLYVIVAILVYIFFITPELFLAKWLVIGVSSVCVWGGGVEGPGVLEGSKLDYIRI